MPTYTINVLSRVPPSGPPMRDFIYRQCKHETRASTCKLCEAVKRRAYYARRQASDPQFRLMRVLRARAHMILKRHGLMKRSKHSKLFGAPVAKVKAYIEARFLPGMTWENWGLGDDKWHLDHIIPLSAYDMSIPGEMERAFHYTNLQPLWQWDNLSKGNRV